MNDSKSVNRLSYNEYQKLAHNTSSPLNNDILEGCHYSLGLFTELAEMEGPFYTLINEDKDLVDMTNIKEEIGDFLWYIAELCTLLNYDMSVISNVSNFNVSTETKDLTHALCLLKKYSGEIADQYKKKLAYGKEINKEMTVIYIAAVIKIVNAGICNRLMFNINNIMYINISKLKLRFPNKFEADKANNRDLDAERNLLEQNDTIIKQSKLNLNNND